MPDQANYDATTVWDSFIFEVAHGVDPVQALNDMLSRSEIELEAGAGRTMLTADRTYYVNPTSGLDTNDGLTTGTAWETIQKAVDFVSGNLDLVSFDVTIQLADDTYVEPVDLKPYLGSGDVTIKGNSVTPANVFWDNRTNTVGANVNGVNAGLWRLDGLKLSTDAVAIRSEGATNIKFQNIDFDISSAFHLGAYYNGIIEATGDYEISGSALNAHMYAVFGGTIITINRTGFRQHVHQLRWNR